MKVDVVLLTKNSVEPCLRKCLYSICNNIPINRLIVVDGNSHDNTVETIMKIKRSNRPKVELIYDSGTRGSARQKGIEAVETKYFAFVDSDVILCDDWFQKAFKLMKNDIGAVWGVAIDTERLWKNWTQAICIIGGLTIGEFYVRSGRMRGQLHDTLIRTESVKDIHIPSELHSYEDEYIRRHIEKRGFKWLPTLNPFCYHFKPHHDVFSESYSTASLGKRYGYFPPRLFMKHLSLSIPRAILILFISRNTEVFTMDLLKEIGFVLGWLGCPRTNQLIKNLK